ncbi:polyprenyl synthetase family protein [Sneathiella sp. P13V-1]|uniref:polyprenyl synthetase family protein n=1 Tax=Sneathiella sp. P13V-1 TaxID=2697366 RepID=UPI00187BA154|nr:polyprenyl synthetase family protein [Sneathiella sp. P13V-1]MBE7637901.1 polyprenyl synthetase family protein [Sneathiella sp. P13V-1]
MFSYALGGFALRRFRKCEAVLELSPNLDKNSNKSQLNASLTPLMDIVADDLKDTNQIILDRMHSDVELIPVLARHLIAAGGKRLRPVLTLGAAKLCGYEGDRAKKLAACVEFIHTATLLHDDVVDESDLRRGNETANAVWGNQASVLVGDFLFSRSFQLMVEDGSLEVLRVLSNASAVIAEGEVLQLMNVGDINVTEESYFEVIAAKTAALFAAATRVGAVVANRPENEVDALEEFGMNLGIAFQLIDDALDYSAEQQSLGKTIGDDFREGKVTMPVLLAYRAGDEEEKAFWTRVIEQEQNDGDLDEAMRLIEKHQTIRGTFDTALKYGDMAKANLGLFADGPEKAALISAVDFAIERAY